MNKKLRIAIFKLIDVMVIFTMVFGSPLSITASALTQDSGPTLTTDESDYETGDSARVTGSGFAAGEYVLAAGHGDDSLDWGSVTVDESGVFVTDSPTLDADGEYEVRVYVTGWSGDWDEASFASTSFTVTAPPPPTETPTEEPTATEPPTAEPTATPTEEPTATEPPTEEPTAEPTNTLTDEPTATEPPTVEPTNTSTDEPTAEPTDTPTEEPTATEPPTAEPTDTPTEEPTQEPTSTSTEEPTATSEPTFEPTSTATVEPTNTPTSEPTPLPDPFIQSDKADYNPGELVTLTGGNWQGDSQVRIIVNDDIGQTWRRDITVDVAPDGTIYDSFNLPIHFVANYSVTARGLQTNRVAIFAFTDAPLPGSVGLVTWRTQPSGAWINGTLQANNSDYSEGETIPFRLELGTLNTANNPYVAPICRDYQLANGVFGFTTLQPFNTSRAATPGGAITSTSGPFSGVNITITNVNETGVSSSGGFNCGSTQRLTIVSFNVSATGPQFLLWGGRLADPSDAGVGEGKSASFWTGGSLQMRLASPDKTSGIQPAAVVRLAKITVQKIVDSGSATPDQWCFNISPNPNGETLPKCPSAGTDTVTFLGLPTGNYQITETNVAGYTFASGTGTSCTFNGSTATANVTSSQNPNSVVNATCVFHNAQQKGTITIIKDSVPDDPQDFSFTTTGTGLSSFTLDDDSNNTLSNTRTFTNLTPGSYTVTEGAVNGWSLTSLNCTDPSNNTTTNPGNRIASINVGAGETVTCTFTNTLQQGTLIVKKVVVNDNGGTLEADDFSFQVNGGSAVTFEADGQNDLTVSPGTYSVTEPAVSGYTTTYNNCSNVNVPPGGSATCTITNNDQPGTLIVKKVVVNDNGGTLEADDFTFQVNGGSAIPFEADGQNNLTVNAGTYTVTEPVVSGYSTTYDNCTDVVVPNGGSATCTITNDDQAATLIIKKVVVTDNGGTLEADDFTFQVNGGSAISFEADGQNELSVSAGTYTVTEPAVSGYTTTYDNCSNVVIPNGGTATCTVTNDDQPGTLIVKKVVISNNGGTLEAEDFSFQVNGGTTIPFEADGQNDVTVNAGTYSVTEPAVPGYTASYDNCSNLVIPNGGSATCTITNDDQAATLIVKKVVINDNGGTLEADDFSFQVNGGGVIVFEADGQNDLSVSAGTYTVTEPSVAGYTTTYDNCSNLVIPNGGTVTCTITNNDQPGTLIVKKVVVNDNGGTLEADDFSFVVNGGSAVQFEADGQNDLTVNAGTYTVTEPAVAGYSTTYDNCDNLAIPNGGSATCTITNNDQAATLIVKKIVVNDSGGTLEAEDFAFQVNGGAVTPFEADGQNDLTVSAGTYTVTEPAVSGYTTTYDNCSNLVIPNGGSATCTITNDDQAATLVVIKHVVNDNGGTAEAGDFTMTVNGTNVQPSTSFPGAEAPGTTVTLNAGSYSVSETSVPGYTSDGGSVDCSGTIANGETKTCTFTNNDDAPSLTLVKVVMNDNGGMALTTDFTLSANGPTPISGAGGATSDASFEAGTYDLSETNVPGYSASAWSCQGGNQTDDDTVEVGLGEDVTCTITNDDDAPSLTLIKQVINDNGGSASAPDFTLSANGPTPISGGGGATSDATFAAGTYDLSETTVPGYTASDWSCVGGNQTDSDTVQVGLGDDVTCTITNNDDAPSLTLVKVVVNDNGGTATAAQWTLTATGPTGFSGAGPSVSSDADFDTGTYALSESGPTSYTASDWACSGGTQNGNNVTLELGESATCTITNDDNAPSLTLVKVVVNDNGGTATEADFTLTATGPTGFSGDGPSVSNGTSFDAGTYDLSETGPAGYSASDWVCSGGTQDDEDTITLGLGESATCTITNDDQEPSLTLVKEVVNNDGGDAVASNWTLTAMGPTGFAGPGPSVSNGASFDAGTYTLSENGPTGYTASAWSCVGGTQNGNEITVANGESATCTITNNDVAPTLKLVKVVNNDNGGNAVADDWVLYAVATAPNDGRNFSNLGGSGDFETIYANTPYNLSESVVAGYTAGSWSCDGGTLVDSTITLGEGETGVTCTITNDDSAPTLTLIKIVVNDDGGDAVVAEFPLFINGDPTTSGQSNTLSANTLYTASETTQPGYTASAWGGDCAPNGTITLNEGQNATCTITNDDVAPTLKLVKVVVNDNGGNAVADDWTLSASAATPSDGRNFSNLGGSGDFETVFANAGYDLSESTVPGYAASAWICDGGTLNGSTITLAEGENVTCTITNDDVAPQLRLVKIVVNDDGGDAVISDFPLFIDGNSVTSGVFVEVTANEIHTASETNQPGYSASSWGGDCAADGTVTLNEGDVKTCTITNDDVAPTLRLVKEVINDNGGNAVADDWTLSADAAVPFDGRNFSNLGGSGDFETVFANAGYDLSETTVPGYTAGNWVCDGGTLVGSTVTLDEGETDVTCTITNDDSAPTLTLIKVVINDNGGNAQPDDFQLTIGGNAATSGTAYTLQANTPYAIDETQLDGYTFVNISGDPECPAVLGGTVTLDEGENVTCTITNDDIAPTLTLIKNVINDHGGNAQPNDFNLTIGGVAATSGTPYTLSANTAYEINETLVSGYGFVNITGDPECPAVLGGTVTLDEGENVTCTITNDDQPATLLIIKHVVNDNGGTADAGDFTLDSGGADDTPDDFPGEEDPGTTVTLDAGAYNVTESGPSGYSASFSADCSGTIANGETKTCTVTNDDIQPQLIVIKHVINDNGGTATAAQFTMNVTGNNATPASFAGNELGTNVALDAGSYSVGETSPDGYAPSFSADCTGTIAVGETKTCTITNNDISPTLTVVKVLLPSDDAGLFNLQIDGVTQAANVGDNGTTGPVAVNAGSHTVGETAGTGTSLSDYVTSIGGDCSADGTVSLALAENKTCTITNIRRGSIVIVKNALGGDDTFDFTSNTLGGFSLTTSGGTASTTFSGLDPANTYDVAETVPAGWELNSATCDNGETIDSINLEPGETVTCTFENEKAGSIVIVKNTVGGDGTFDFTSSTLGNFTLTTNSGTASTTFNNLDVDLTYDVAETVPAGWDLTNATCDGGEAVDSIDLEPGETVTCTFTNTQRGHIIIDKVTLPSGDPQSFAFTTTGSGYTGFNLTDTAAPNDQILPPGTYSVAETVPAGWDLTGLDCTDPSGAPVRTDNKVTINLAAGETVNCTFTNTKRGTITITKDALPNDAQDFAFTTTGSGLSNFSLDDDSTVTLSNSKTFTNLLPGAYSVTEGAVAGWDLTSLTCNDANGTTSPGTRRADINLDPGENVTCTFTNTKRGTIIVEKQTNPNGAPGNFTFTGTAAGTIADNGTITVTNLVPGTYTSTEADPSPILFALTSIACNDGSSANPSTGNITTRTATFKLDPGETVRCVFTNTKDFHAGTIGFWKNWRNHYTSAQAQLLINYLKSNNPKIYNKDLVNNNADDFTIAKWDAIFNLGTKTPREQMILAQFTALKLNLAITQLDGTGGLVQKNDDLCTAGTVNVAGISGATVFFGTSTPTVGQIVNAVENRWTGNLTTNRNDWKWNLTNAQKDMIINVVTGINEGTLVMSSGCP